MKQKFKIIMAVMLTVTSVLVLIAVSYQLLSLQKEKTPEITDSDGNSQQSRHLAVKLSQVSNLPESEIFNITQGSSIEITVVLSSLSNDTEFTIPLYLSIDAFENQHFAKMITSPSSPYPALPWSGHKDSPEAAKPFEANFDLNPLTLKSEETTTTSLTITAFEDANVGKYTMFLEMGNWEQTGLAAVTFQIIVNPRQ